MDWNNINRDRDTSSLGPIEYDQTKVPQLIRKHADNVRGKTYGQEVREAQARNAEYAGLIASEAKEVSTSTQSRQDIIESRYDVAVGAMTSETEILDARVSEEGLTFSNLKERLDSQQNAINVLSHGAVGDGVTDDTLSFENAIIAAVSTGRYLLVPTGFEFSVRVDITASNLKIIGGGKLIPLPTYTDYVLKLSGDNIEVSEIEIEERTYNHKPLYLTGQKNLVKECKVYNPEKSTRTSMIYSDALIYNEGNYNSIVSCEVYNGRIGISSHKKFNYIRNNSVHDNVTGVQLGSSARDTDILENKIFNNNVNDASGADGILATRNVRRITISGNTIHDSGEHGIYFQGDNSIITNNHVTSSHGSGIKLASYTTGLFFYPEETEIANYVGSNNIVSDNVVSNNGDDGNVNSGIYLQAPLKHITVKGNDVNHNGHGIRSVFVYEGQELSNITVIGNRAYDNVYLDYSLQCASRLRVSENSGDGVSITTSLNMLNKDAAVSDNDFDDMLTSGTVDCVISGNKLRNIRVINNCIGTIIDNNDITELGDLNFSRIVDLIGNRITVAPGARLTSSTVANIRNFSNNRITFSSISSDYVIDFNVAYYHRNLRVENNTFVTLSATSFTPINISFNHSNFSNNIFTGTYNGSKLVQMRGSNNVVSGNVAETSAVIEFASGANNILTGNNSAIGYGGTDSILANNRA